MYYTYMLRCRDNSIYTGITTDLKRRMDEHFMKSEKCAKYTYHHTAQKLEVAWETDDRKSASKLEYHIKTLTKLQKESLINNTKSLNQLLENKVECDKYELVKNI